MNKVILGTENHIFNALKLKLHRYLPFWISRQKKLQNTGTFLYSFQCLLFTQQITFSESAWPIWRIYSFIFWTWDVPPPEIFYISTRHEVTNFMQPGMTFFCIFLNVSTLDIPPRSQPVAGGTRVSQSQYGTPTKINICYFHNLYIFTSFCIIMGFYFFIQIGILSNILTVTFFVICRHYRDFFLQ